MPSYVSLCRMAAGFAFTASLGITALSGGVADNVGWILGGSREIVSAIPPSTSPNSVVPFRSATPSLRHTRDSVSAGHFSLESMFVSPIVENNELSEKKTDGQGKKDSGGESFFSSSAKDGAEQGEAKKTFVVPSAPPIVIGFFGSGEKEGVFASLPAAANPESERKLFSKRYAALRPGAFTSGGWKYVGRRGAEAVFLSPDGTETSVAPSASSVSVPSSSVPEYDGRALSYPEQGPLPPEVFDTTRGTIGEGVPK